MREDLVNLPTWNNRGEIAMNRQADSQRKTSAALITCAVGAALPMCLETRRFIRPEDVRRTLFYAMRKLGGLGVFVFGLLLGLRAKLSGQQGAFQNELDRAVLSDLATAAEPSNPRFRPRDAVRGARHSIGRVPQFSLPRDEMLRQNRSEIAAECHVRAHEHAIAAGHCQTHALVMRVA